MFGNKNDNGVKAQAINSLIGPTTTVEGNIHFTGGLRIDGTVKGNVIASTSAKSMLVASESATIEGEVHGDHLVINGTINGPIVSRTLIELQPKARINGDVHYVAIEMHHGALVTGRLNHINPDQATLALPSPDSKKHKPKHKDAAQSAEEKTDTPSQN